MARLHGGALLTCFERILRELTTVRIDGKLLEIVRATNAKLHGKDRINISRLAEAAIRAELARRGIHDSSKEE